MFNTLLRFRYLFVGIIVFSTINSVAFLVMGAVKSIKGYIEIFKYINGATTERPGMEILEGFDNFSRCCCFLIFSLGILKLFFVKSEDESQLPKWLDIKDLQDLKILLWETILVALVVFSMSNVIRNIYAITWQVLLLPGYILLLTISLQLVRGDKKANHKSEA